jgi:hypothetical protein
VGSVKPLRKYLDAVDVEGYSRSVAEDAESYARSALLRRRPDLKDRKGGRLHVPDDERAQYDLDRLTFVHAVADRLKADMTPLVFAARQRGASWARIGLAIDESGQTSFNRYHKLEI